jgi:creatinine amidohydrolase
MMLHLYPDLVRRDRLANFSNELRELAKTKRRMGHNGRSGIAWLAQDLNPEGVMGNAAAASADKGKRLVDYFAEELALRLADLADHNISD